ncbi:hypothetical protein H2201_008736 [Coniosporium apollinis]|uniref:EGF-like domain-containing protein n=1 Tax=Coniosporium apollinis TaxID=61459 RepID=A0ABQ9NFH1_9PEZI|nr:hypothetical protein H2201_008736 [Coniosporium apollinis]
MSYAPPRPLAPTGASDLASQDGRESRGGSVKAARERLRVAKDPRARAAVDARQRRADPPSRTPPSGSQVSPQRNGLLQQPELLTPPSSSESARGFTHPPGPQWPLPDNKVIEPPRGRSPPGQQQSGKKTPPQRPPRPNHLASALDPTAPQPVNTPSASHPAKGGLRPPQNTWHEDDSQSPTFASPDMSRPVTISSQTSSGSSSATIPDFPIPAMHAAPRRSPNLGPPPSARRGPSSYYSNMSYVSPIAEETESRKSRGSFASSTVIPGRGIQDFFEDATPSEEEGPAGLEHGRESRASDHGEESGLVRKASLGKRHKPALTTIKSGDNLRTLDKEPAQNQKPPKKGGIVGQAAVAAGAAGGAFAAGLGQSRDRSQTEKELESGFLSSGTGLLDPSSPSNSSTESLDDFKRKEMMLDTKTPPARSAARSPLPPVDSKVEQILGGLEKGGALDSDAIGRFKSPTQTSLSERVGSRRPPRLDVDSIRDAEARGSLTSLPDLIRRATRLAANLDRGKTASRLGLNHFDSNSSDRHRFDDEKRRSGSLSDILSSFPPPGLGSSIGDGTPGRTISRMPSNLAMGQSASNQPSGSHKSQPRRRKCCGMPLWGFATLLVILLILIIAAIIIPIVLIVLPNREANAAAAADRAIAECQRSLTCENAGTAVLGATGTCSCLCSNGFTGERCTTVSDAGCVTTNIAGVNDATVGSAIPRLLQDAQTNFSIPLDAKTLLSLFSSTNLRCASENALVTFSGLSARSVPDWDNIVAPDPPPSPSTTSPPRLPRRQQTTYEPGIAQTSNGVIFAARPTSSPTDPSPSPAPSSSTASPESDALRTNATVLDFARVAVLYVFQESRTFDAAVDAQGILNGFFAGNLVVAGGGGGGVNATALGLENGFGVDLVGLRVLVRNGSWVP